MNALRNVPDTYQLRILPKGEAPELMEMQRGFKDTTAGAKAAKSGATKGAADAKQKRKEA